MSARRWSDRRWLALAALLAAGWPVLSWLGRRFTSGEELAPSLVAAALAVGVVLRAPADPRIGAVRSGWQLASGWVLVYAAALAWLPPLVQAACWMVALAATLRCLRLGTVDGAWLAVLLVLALPVVPSLQFVLGYPLRHAVALAAAALLQLEGLPVEASGAVLRCGEALVVVDAPCSGVRMLWTSLLLAAGLGAWHRLRLAKGGLLLAAAILAALAANVARAAALFHWETRPPAADPPASAHAAIGLATFALAALAIVHLGSRLRRSGACAPS